MRTPYQQRKIRRDPWWHAAGLSLGIVFSLMLMTARLYPMYLDDIDRAVENILMPYQTFGHIELFLAITILGGTLGITIVACGAAMLLRKNRLSVFHLGTLLLFASVSMGIAKTFVERARPESLLWIDPLNSYSFPSGHATLTTALYGFLAVMLWRRTHRASARIAIVLSAAAIIFSVSVSRLVLNVHYFTDIVAGIVLGSFWLCVIFMLPKPKKGKL